MGAVLLFSAATIVLGLLIGLAPLDGDPPAVILRLAAPLFLLGVAGGAIVTPNQTLTLADVDPARGGVAGGVVQTAQRLGGAVGQTVLGTSFVLALGSTPRTDTPGVPAPNLSVFDGAVVVALAVSLVFSLAALAVSVAGVRRARR